MGVKILFLYLLRLTILLLSLGTLGCHVAQLILLNQIPGTGPWWPKFIPYILYYVGPIVSILSATILLLVNCVFSKSLWSDRITSCINLLLFIAIIVYNSLMSGTVPWTGSAVNPISSPVKGYVTYCSRYSDRLISNRCWLTNGTWLGMIVVGFFWLLLALYTFVLKDSDVYAEDYDAYDFKDDVPMAKTTTNSTALGGSGIYETPPHNNPTRNPYNMMPHRDYANQSQETYYYSTQGTPVYDYNNSEVYMNPMPVEDHYAYKATSPLQQQHNPMNGFERQRKVSKTYLGDDEQNDLPPSNNNNNNNTTTTKTAIDSPEQEPPHSYDGY